MMEQAELRYRISNRGREPAWRRADGALRRRVPAALRSWLIDTASLTERLRGIFGGSFRVNLRGQRWERPGFSERAVLGMADHRVALIREVHLQCAGSSVVFARTIMPAEALCGSGRRLARLGERPLGAMLFANRSIVRGDLEIARVEPGCDIYATAAGATTGQGLWGRRSIFLVGGQPILVNEIFLPAILREAP